ncbi:MAG: NAD-dependent epimerase/dehydratase family protein [Caldilineaceae bacterium]
MLTSTSSLYDQDNLMRWQEEQNTSQPLSPYAGSKKAVEVLCYTYHYLCGIDVTGYRYFTVYGPAGRPDMVSFVLYSGSAKDDPLKSLGMGNNRAILLLGRYARSK